MSCLTILRQCKLNEWGEMRTQTGGTVALPSGHLEPPFHLVCAQDLYSENLSTVQSRLLVYEKRVTATHP